MRIVNGERVVRSIPWEDGVGEISCPYCNYKYDAAVDWGAENWNEKEIYKDTIKNWQDNLPYKVKCLNCNKWLIFDPVNKTLKESKNGK